MFYSYDYKALNNKSANGQASLREDDAATQQNIELDVESSDFAPVINAESIRDVPVGRYSFAVTMDGEDFTLVNYDSFVEGLMERFGVEAVREAESEYADKSLSALFDDLCDEKFGACNWGYEENYSECCSCHAWIDTEDLYDDDYWVNDDGDFLCGACVRESPGQYLASMADNVHSESELLTADEFEGNGWELVDSLNTFDPFPRTPRERTEMLSRMREERPGWHFIFDASCINAYPHEYRIWGKSESDPDDDSEGDEL